MIRLCALLLFFWLPVAHAFDPQGWPGNTSGGTTTYGGGTVDSRNVGRHNFPHTVGGPVHATSDGKVRLPGGRVIDVTGKAPLSPLAVGTAIGKAAAKVLPVLGWGLAIRELMDDLGYAYEDGQVRRTDPTICSVAPCYEYANSLFDSSMWFPTAQQAADRALGRTWYGQPICSAVVVSGTYFKAIYGSSCQSETGLYDLLTRSKAPAADSYVDSSFDELAQAIASQSGWPSGSPIGEALKEAIESGEVLPLPQPTEITGPASVTGPSTTKTDVAKDAQGNPIGTTTTVTNTTYNITYGPNTVTVTTVNNTTQTNPDGTTTESTSTEETPSEEDPEIEASDTPLPSQPTLYERKYPDGLAGVWATRKAQLLSSPLASSISGLMPQGIVGGTCPVWTAPLDVGLYDFGQVDYSPPCWIWDFCRFIIICSALLLARRLVFGG